MGGFIAEPDRIGVVERSSMEFHDYNQGTFAKRDRQGQAGDLPISSSIYFIHYCEISLS